MTTSSAVKTTQTLAAKIKARTTEPEPKYEINGILKLVGDQAPHHEGPDITDDMAKADAKNPTISDASNHNPLKSVTMEHQSFHVGGVLDV